MTQPNVTSIITKASISTETDTREKSAHALMKPDWKKLALSIDKAIRAGKIPEAKIRLSKLEGSEIPRSDLARFAELARRAALPDRSLRWLRRFVRPAARRGANLPTPQETIEYAAALIRLGAVSEARELLEPIDPNIFPRAGFEQASALISEWRYAEAIPYLQTYVSHRATPEYERNVGKLNLAAALVYVRKFTQATALFRGVLHDVSVRKNTLLLGLAYQVGAQALFARGKSKEAAALLARAEKELIGSRTMDAFFLKKWRAFLSFEKGNKQSELLITQLRNEAEAEGRWETCRDCDRFLAIELGNVTLLHRVYFGTPYEAFRESLLNAFGRSIERPKDYLHYIGEAPPKKILDLALGSLQALPLANRPTLQRALLVLASDFYAPFRIAALFQRLYPEEYYHPGLSANRVHKTLQLLRDWLKEHAEGVHLIEEHGAFRLGLRPGWAVRVGAVNTLLAENRETPRLRELRTSFGTEFFNARSAAQRLGVSSRSALRLLQTGQEQALVERVGKRALARYRFTK